MDFFETTLVISCGEMQALSGGDLVFGELLDSSWMVWRLLFLGDMYTASSLFFLAVLERR